MCKTLLLFFLCGMFLASCTAVDSPASAATPVPLTTFTAVSQLPTLVKEIKLETQTGTSYTLDWSHDGETLAVGSGYEITLLQKDLRAAPTVIKPGEGTLAVSWSPSGEQLATVNGYRNQAITVWDLDRNTGKLTRARQIDGGSDQYGVSWSPDGRILATLGDDDKTTIQIWDTGTWEEVHRYELPYANPRRALNWSADSTILYDAGEADGQTVVIALNVNDGTVQELWKFSTDELQAFAISPDARMLVIADKHGVLHFIDLSSGERTAKIKTVDQPVDVAWNPDGRILAVLDYKTRVQVWEASY